MREILVPWVEKFRPRTLDEVVAQDSPVATLKRFVETGNLPHLLFHGPPGTGKTSAILALTNDLFGPVMLRQRVLELNASDERGISTIREKVKRFAQQSIAAKPSNYTHPCPPFKIIILDEADSLTSDAQSALRRVIEIYTKVTRFCLVCNYVSKIIDPIASRCAKFRFTPLPPDVAVGRLKEIVIQEKVACDDANLEVINDISKGDLRRAITLLHSVHRLYKTRITKDRIVELAGIVPDVIIQSLMHVFQVTQSQRDLNTIIENDIVRNGYPAVQLIEQIGDEIIKVHGINSIIEEGKDTTENINSKQKKQSKQSMIIDLDDDDGQKGLKKDKKVEMDKDDETGNDEDENRDLVGLRDEQKAQIALSIAQTERMLIDGANEELQIKSLLSLILGCFRRG
ncbi:MAG: putative Replication factor C subunit 2 [Streblomastix strix]|uniref:Putative Replication factor C subunit 2 n=2 Tax=Streblomastix strix TaxID=222440 RepID=A0A5J4WUM8_9EUKA|nr:MAG: putative Replication factor C subunit 2 [Streblomastix strix]